MHLLQSSPWIEPLDLAASLDHENGNDEPFWVLLYSGIKTSYSGRYSYLACNLKERATGKDFSALTHKLSNNVSRFDNSWFGYLGYGLKDSLEKLLPDNPNWLSLPNLCMMRFGTIIQFDHEARDLKIWSDQANVKIPALLTKPDNQHDIVIPRVTSLTSNMTKESYLEKAAQVIERIHNGDLYQANLTRKFTGTFSEPPEPFTLFRKLCAISPAPYSAFLRMDDTCILSSSPELFLQIDAGGNIRTRPVKGTAPRFSDKALDRKSFDALASSPKDRAENLMIVDLMRNDLSRSCHPGSVVTQSLFEVTSHTAVHHMASTVVGQKQPQQFSEPRDGLFRQFRIFVHQRGHGVQRIEEEMRMQLHAQRLQLRLHQLGLELGGATHACLVALVINDGVFDAEYADIQQHTGVEGRLHRAD